MGSFFVVRVHTGFEIEAKEMLKTVLNRKGVTSFKNIYAMEKVDSIGENFSRIDMELLEGGDSSQFLHVKRIQSTLTTLRNSMTRLKHFNDEDSIRLYDEYRQTLREVTARLSEARKNTKKIGSVLQGYILVELQEDITTFPAELVALIKSVPKIIGLLDRNNVPKEEIESFFNQIESINEEIEMEFELPVDLTDTAEVKRTKDVLLAKSNDVIGTAEEQELLEQHDELNIDLEKEIETLAMASNKSDKTSFEFLLQQVKIKRTKLREKVTIPLRLFNTLFKNEEDRRDRLLKMWERTDFVKRLRSFFQLTYEEYRQHERS